MPVKNIEQLRDSLHVMGTGKPKIVEICNTLEELSHNRAFKGSDEEIENALKGKVPKATIVKVLYALKHGPIKQEIKKLDEIDLSNYATKGDLATLRSELLKGTQPSTVDIDNTIRGICDEMVSNAIAGSVALAMASLESVSATKDDLAALRREIIEMFGGLLPASEPVPEQTNPKTKKK